MKNTYFNTFEKVEKFLNYWGHVYEDAWIDLNEFEGTSQEKYKLENHFKRVHNRGKKMGFTPELFDQNYYLKNEI